jgi:hypothetical protein
MRATVCDRRGAVGTRDEVGDALDSFAAQTPPNQAAGVYSPPRAVWQGNILRRGGMLDVPVPQILVHNERAICSLPEDGSQIDAAVAVAYLNARMLFQRVI